MKILRIIAIMLCLFSATSLCTLSEEAKLSIYVSPTGNDYADGSFENPFKTIYRAREEVRYKKRNGSFPESGVNIVLEEGEYFLKEPLNFFSTDSNISFMGENAVITGGVSIDSENTVTPDENIMARIKETVRDKIKCYDLSFLKTIKNPLEVTAMSIDKSDYIITFNGSPLINARYPDNEEINVNDVYKSGTANKTESFIIGYQDENISLWQNPEETYIEGYGDFLWKYQKVGVKSIDSVNKKITSNETNLYSPVFPGAKIWFSNVLEELSSEGEYYIDRVNKKLYVYTPEETGEISISISEKSLINVINTENISFSGITFENTRASAINVNGGNNIVIDGCVVRNTGSSGIKITDSKKSGVKNSLITQTGDGGIKFYSCGKKFDLTPSENFVINNEICDFSRIVTTYAPAVWMNGIKDTISYNTIHDSYHNAIILGGNDNIISNNEIYNVLMGTSDAGAIYIYGDGSSRGNIIENNFIHHLGKGKTAFNPSGIHAIYFDNFNSGQTVRNNLFYDMPSGVTINSGGDHEIENNIFVAVNVPVYAHALDSIPSTDMWNSYLKLYKNESVWIERYPELEFIPDPLKPSESYRNNIIKNNIFSVYSDISKIETRGAQITDNTETEECIFVNPGEFDFSLKEEYRDLISFDIENCGIRISQ